MLWGGGGSGGGGGREGYRNTSVGRRKDRDERVE